MECWQNVCITASAHTWKDNEDTTELLYGKLRGALGLELMRVECLDLQIERFSRHAKHWQICAVLPGPDGPLSPAKCKEFSESTIARQMAEEDGLDLTFQPGWLMAQHKTPGLAVFDMDSTLIQQEVIDELARKVGKYEQVAAITEAAMRGELDFEASLRARVKELKGVPVSIWDELKMDIISFTPGAKDLAKVLKHEGWKLAVLSGGFMPLATWVRDTLKLDYAFANQLVVDEVSATLTGELVPGAPIVHATRKRELLEQLAKENNTPMHATFAVGDGSNDLLMMKAAGFGIAFNAKPKVQAEAPAKLNTDSLLDVMYLLGYTKSTMDKILSPSATEDDRTADGEAVYPSMQ